MSFSDLGAGLGAVLGAQTGWDETAGNRQNEDTDLSGSQQDLAGAQADQTADLAQGDAQSRSAQLQALQQLQAQYAAGGMDAQAQSAMADANANANQQASANRNAVATSAAQRGMSNSGTSLAAQRSAGQAAANTAATMGQQAAAAGEQRATTALTNSANVAANMGQQADAISQFNANQKQQAQQNSFSNRMNQATGYNNEANAEMGNAQQTMNYETGEGKGVGAAAGGVMDMATGGMWMGGTVGHKPPDVQNFDGGGTVQPTSAPGSSDWVAMLMNTPGQKSGGGAGGGGGGPTSMLGGGGGGGSGGGLDMSKLSGMLGGAGGGAGGAAAMAQGGVVQVQPQTDWVSMLMNTPEQKSEEGGDSNDLGKMVGALGHIDDKKKPSRYEQLMGEANSMRKPAEDEHAMDNVAGFSNLQTPANGYAQGGTIKNTNRGDFSLAASRGGKVPGQAAVPGNSPVNDTVPTMLSPGELVIPRSAMSDPRAALAFVQAHFAKQGK